MEVVAAAAGGAGARKGVRETLVSVEISSPPDSRLVGPGRVLPEQSVVAEAGTR